MIDPVRPYDGSGSYYVHMRDLYVLATPPMAWAYNMGSCHSIRCNHTMNPARTTYTREMRAGHAANGVGIQRGV